MRARIYAVVLMMSLVGAGGCSSSKKATDSPVASVDATLALEPAAIPDTTAAPDTTVAPDTTAGSAATTAASEATVAAESPEGLITGFLKSMNGGKAPSAKDIKCVSSKVDPAAMAALGAATSATPDPKVLLPVVKSIFSCKPDGLVDSLSSSLGTMPAGVTPEQTKCIASGLVDVMGSDDKLLELTMTTGSLKGLPKADRDTVAAKLTPTVNKCVDGDLRAKVLAELQK